ncbi:1-phosphatidylinositol phosphodiesterase-like [Trichomycterus rosablanca]|uniref:1-phosphatidylinositol phosphodiesterase-like n=1 Tax=Trichomycterus rosablanca TaxID=2290929 RepID=UPI002F351FD1
MQKTKVKQMFGLLLLIMFLHGNINGQSQNQAFNDEQKLQLPESYKIDWMKELPDNTILSGITLPGTHDTMALDGGPAAECQVWSLDDQLRAGIRYLDLRVFAWGNELYLMHGIVYQHSTFSKAIDTIKNFLSEYPSEVVLVRVKPDLIDKSKVQELVEKLIKNDSSFWVKSTTPAIKQVRGKIVFVQKDSFSLGVPLVETDTKGDYKVDHIKDKENEIHEHLNQAMTMCPWDSLVLTYSSGTGIGTFLGMFLTPKRVAEQIDPWLYDYLNTMLAQKPVPCFGVIAMDFPGLDLIQTVIKFNTLKCV